MARLLCLAVAVAFAVASAANLESVARPVDGKKHHGYKKPIAKALPIVHYPKCYKDGERCMGAIKMPFVKYYPCCPGYVCTGAAYGYGKKCVKVHVQVAAHAPHHGHGYHKGHYDHKCYKIGERCIGAPGKPFVKYYPCCDHGATCTGKDSYYGLTCEYAKVKSVKGYEGHKPKCYKLGERCSGASNMPFVHYAPCCDHGATCTGKDHHYGHVCAYAAKKHYGYKKPMAHAAPIAISPIHHGYKCYKEGERCMGAPGFASIHYKPCCAGLHCKGSHHHYGKTCVKHYPGHDWKHHGHHGKHLGGHHGKHRGGHRGMRRGGRRGRRGRGGMRGPRVPETTNSLPTEAPVSDVPATDAPATDAPATDAPATDAPATDAPATEAPGTAPPNGAAGDDFGDDDFGDFDDDFGSEDEDEGDASSEK